MLDRRDFLATLSSAVLFAPWLAAADAVPNLKITRAVAFKLPLQRSKIAGRNAIKDVHGDRTSDRMVRLYTNAGIEAIGNSRASEKDVSKLLGQNLVDFFVADARRMGGPLGVGTMPLWDLAGKALRQPVYQLLGAGGEVNVPVYDGSIYFADLLPQYAERWRDRFKEEIDMGLRLGHRAFKIKIGRGKTWMPRSEGDDRDVEVVELIRRHAGSDVRLGVDANNGYDLAGAKRFLQRVSECKLAFAEEMFPEQVQECLEFKHFIRDNGWQTLVADGETQKQLDAYQPFIDAKAIDVFQGDMNVFGVDGILNEAEMAARQGLRVAPHNWGSLVGYFMQLHVGRAIPNLYMAEHDPLSTPVLRADGYSIETGRATVSDAPGFGLTLDEEAFARMCPVEFDVRA